VQEENRVGVGRKQWVWEENSRCGKKTVGAGGKQEWVREENSGCGKKTEWVREEDRVGAG
jgi:hypothetical protein